MIASEEITQDLLDELLSYDEDTGLLYWKKRDRRFFNHDRACNAWNSRFDGTIAGYDNVHHGYSNLQIFGTLYRSHRIIWLLVHGEWPDQIDHINGVKTDNSLKNLRNVGYYENVRNRRLSSRNKSGLMGVRYDESRKRWTVTLGGSEGSSWLGSYGDLFEAACVRKSAENRNNFHKNHGVNYE